MKDLAIQTHLSPDDVILTAGEAQVLTRTSHTTLRKLAESGAIPFVTLSDKPRAHRRYRLSDLKAFLNKSTVTKS